MHPTPSPEARPSLARLRITPTGEVLSANQALLENLAFESESELREWAPRIHDLFAEHGDRADLEEPLEAALAADEVRWIRKDGTSLWVRIRVATGASEEPRMLEVEVEDVTGRRHLEEQLRNANRLEFLGQLAGGMAADVHNLFTTVLAHVELLEEALVEGDLGRARSDLGEVRKSATTGSQMIKHLLSYSQGERVRLQPVGLEDVVRDSRRLLLPLLSRGMTLRIDPHPVGPVLADPAAVEQMLRSLVTNAVAAMSEGGHVQIRVGRGGFDRQHLMQTGWGDPGDYGVVTVTDTGEGMPPRVVARLFQPFAARRTGDEADPGLTLSMVYGLMKQHRGFIEVESEPGAGTTVRLYFRLASSPTRTAFETEVAEERPPTSGTILFVEDDESLRRVACRVLRSKGYRVLEAHHGLAALEVIEREGMPDLMITDLVMPSMTGPELVHRLEALDVDLPAILLTSGYEPDFLENAGEGVLDHPFLEKPWTLEFLVREVRTMMKRRAGEG